MKNTLETLKTERKKLDLLAKRKYIIQSDLEGIYRRIDLNDAKIDILETITKKG